MLTINKTNIRTLTVLVGGTAAVLATAGLAPALPAIASAFPAVPNADLLVRLMLTMPALVGAISAPYVGFLSDRLGRKPVILASCLLFGLAGTAGYVLNSLPAILLSRAILGLATAGVANGFVILIADYFSGEKFNQINGYLGAFAGFSSVVFQSFSGYLAGIGWRFPFLMHLFGFALLIAVLFAVEEPQLQQPQVNTKQQPSPTPKTAFPLQTIALVYAVGLLGMALFFVTLVHLPFYLTTQAGASSSQIGLALALQTLPSGLIALSYRQIRARFSFQAITLFVFLTLGIELIIISLTTNYVLIILGLLIGGMGVGLLPSNVIAWVASLTPAAVRGRAIGGLNSAVLFGQFLAPITTQPLVEQLGISATFALVGGFALLLAALFAWMTLAQSRFERLKIGR